VGRRLDAEFASASDPLDVVAGTVLAMDELRLLDPAQDESPGPPDVFVDDDHRWAGWRDSEPVPLPTGNTVDRATVVRALRCLPARQRLLLLARDAAGIPRDRLPELVPGSAGQLGLDLDQARLDYASALAALLVAS
jgi:hypothetical protein